MGDALALSALDWWTEAGVDTLADDSPRDWLARPRPAAPLPEAAPMLPAAVTPPADLAAFRRYLLTDPTVPGAPRARLDAAGDPASGCMVVVDMPEAADRGTGHLLGGEAGALFDRMLAAIALTRDALYLAPFAPARPATGKLSADECATLERLMRQHLALVRPWRLLLLGDAPVCALLGEPATQARGRTHRIDIGGTAVAAIASFHPRRVQGPELRRFAWADLQAFKGLAS